MSNFDFEANTRKAKASSIGQERRFNSQSAVKQAVPLAKHINVNRLFVVCLLVTKAYYQIIIYFTRSLRRKFERGVYQVNL